MLNLGVDASREGQAPAEPCVPDNVVPGSRLSRSFALPRGMPQPSIQDLTRR